MVKKIISIISLTAAVICGASQGYAQVTTGNLDQSADQGQGQYQPMNMGYAGFNSLGMTQAAWLDPLQNLGEGQTKPAYSKYYWSPDLVLPIRLREGMMTLINFPEWEMVEDVFIGDNATFDGQITAPNALLLYPRKGANVGVDTNIIIFGRSGNRYVFYVKSEGVNTERLTNSIIDIDVIGGKGGGKNAYAGGGSKGNLGSGNSNSVASSSMRRFQTEDWLKEIPVDPEKFRFDIEVYVPNPDDVVIAPERVWRDDIFTYIDLGKKALNMNQRPIVTMIVERIEVPVGFRAKGPDNRLIVVEGIGDMVLRNGKRLVCLKLRRDDAEGLQYADYADNLPPRWDVPAPIPESNPAAGGAMGNSGGGLFGGGGQSGGTLGSGSGYKTGYPGQYDINVDGSQIIVPQYNQGGMNGMNGVNIDYSSGTPGAVDYSKMQRLSNNSGAGSKYAKQYGYGTGFADANSNISVELGTDAKVDNLEKLWDNLSAKYPKLLKRYEPFFSVDAPADGQGKELFHLRIGPIKTLDEGDGICSSLGRNGVFCSVVRTQ